MAATETSSASSLLRGPLSPSERFEKTSLRLKRLPTAATPKPSSAVSRKRKCRCSPTSSGSCRRCSINPRRLAIVKLLVNLKPKRRRSASIAANEKKPRRRRRGGGITTSDSGLNMRKTAMANSLAGLGSVEAERCRKYLKESMVKPLSLWFGCKYRPRPRPRPRPSRFHALHKDRD